MDLYVALVRLAQTHAHGGSKPLPHAHTRAQHIHSRRVNAVVVAVVVAIEPVPPSSIFIMRVLHVLSVCVCSSIFLSSRGLGASARPAPSVGRAGRLVEARIHIQTHTAERRGARFDRLLPKGK